MKKHSYGLRAIIAALGLVIFGAAAHAQAPAAKGPAAPAAGQPNPSAPPPSATALGYARDILAAKNVQSIYENAVPALVQRAKVLLLQSNLNLSKDLDDVAIKVSKEYVGREKELGEQFVKIYAYTFSEQELKEILAFYKTPTGKKVIELEPVAFAEANRFMTEWSTAFQEEANQKMRAEMKARGKPVF